MTFLHYEVDVNVLYNHILQLDLIIMTQQKSKQYVRDLKNKTKTTHVAHEQEHF